MMVTSDKGRVALANREACVLTVYRDSKGIPTIGVGHTKAAGLPDPRVVKALKLDECMALFAHDLAKYEAGVRKAFTRDLEQHEFDAAVSFHYNTGAIGRAGWVKLFNQGAQLSEIKKSFLSWKKPKSIIKRRNEEWTQFATGYTEPVDTVLVYASYPGKPRKVALHDLKITPTLVAAAETAPPPQQGTATMGGFISSGWGGIILRHGMSILAGVLATNGVIDATQQADTTNILTNLAGAAFAGVSSLVLSKLNKKEARAPLQ